MRGLAGQDGRVMFCSVFTVVFLLMASATIVSQEKRTRVSSSSDRIQLKKFASYAELENFVGTNPTTVIYGTGQEDFALDMMDSKIARSAPDFSINGAFLKLMSAPEVYSPNLDYESDYVRYRIGYPDTPDHSTTNVQVHGVDEADIVKTDGRYLYVVSKDRVFILSAYPPEGAKVLTEIQLDTSPLGIFVNGDRLVVFESRKKSDFAEPKMTHCWWRPSETAIKVYDISDRRNPLLLNEIALSGTYFNSRMKGDYVYVVANARLAYSDNKIILPEISAHGKKRTIPATEIYYFDNLRPPYVFTTITAIDIQNAEETTERVILMNAAHNMYVSLTNMYMSYRNKGKTVIHKISLSDGKVTYRAQGEVPGRLLNQFSMDEYEGYFRIATTTGHVARTKTASARNHIYVLDKNLEIVGKLENLAPGEKIYSARFMGDRAYLVTFKKVDPLFAVDLSNPRDPEVLGKLKIPGYSDYLHPYDKNHLIGIGKSTVAAEGGDFAWYKGVKIALFDVSDVNDPEQVSKFIVGDRGTESLALKNHKAFLFSKSKNLLVIPITLAEIDEERFGGNIPPYTRGEYVWQGAYVFDISLEEGLGLKGRISHGSNISNSYYLRRSNSSVKRSLYIENVLYTFSQKKIKMNALGDLGEINEIKLFD